MTKLALVFLVFIVCGWALIYQFRRRKKAEKEERRAEKEMAQALAKKKDTKYTRLYSP
jgi:hypothetical protein